MVYSCATSTYNIASVTTKHRNSSRILRTYDEVGRFVDRGYQCRYVTDLDSVRKYDSTDTWYEEN